ncbi:MAG: DUF1801 domain-containing protein [Cyclobacteriaceae bacterium]
MEKLLKYSGKDIQEIDMDPWLEQKPEDLRPIAIKWFNAIKKCGSDVEDIFHDDYPIGCVETAPFAYVNVFTSHVNVGFFYGAELPDQKGLLEGTGKRMRHIKLRPDSTYDDKEILTLIYLAYTDVKARLLLE